MRAASGVTIVLLAAALMVIGLVWGLAAVAQGWLLTLAITGSIPLGILGLALIHGLTGGAWGEASRPMLRAGSLLVPLLAVAFVPLLFDLRAVYPWVAESSGEVRAYYLTPVFFAGRALVVLAIWSLLGILVARNRLGPGVAALGLAFHALAVSVIPVDWFLSTDPHHVSTTYGVLFVIRSLAMGLALVACIAPPVEDRVRGDIGGLLIATLLGCVYLELMTYIVVWYGNLPEKVAWYVRRQATLPTVAIMAAAILSVLVFALLLPRSFRCSRAGLRLAGSLVLLAAVADWVYTLAPDLPAGGSALASAVVSVGLLIVLAIAIVWLLLPLPEQSQPRVAGHAVEQSPRPLVRILQPLNADIYRRPVERALGPAPEPTRLEPPGVAARPVLASVGGFLVVVICAMAGLGYFLKANVPGPLTPVATLFPAPGIAFPKAASAQDRERQRNSLDEDHAAGVARIPITRAMDVIAGRGGQAFDPVAQGGSAP